MLCKFRWFGHFFRLFGHHFSFNLSIYCQKLIFNFKTTANSASLDTFFACLDTTFPSMYQRLLWNLMISLAWTTFCEPLQTLRRFSTTKTGPVTRKLVSKQAERVSKQAEFAVVYVRCCCCINHILHSEHHFRQPMPIDTSTSFGIHHYPITVSITALGLSDKNSTVMKDSPMLQWLHKNLVNIL